MPNYRMRVILQRREGGLYLQPGGRWSESRETAMEFISSVAALSWAWNMRLAGVDILLAFEEPERDLRLAVD